MDRMLKYKKVLRVFRVPDGWRDLGATPAEWEGGGRVTWRHKHCGDTRTRNGLTDRGTDFCFCPKCRIVLNPLPEAD